MSKRGRTKNISIYRESGQALGSEGQEPRGKEGETWGEELPEKSVKGAGNVGGKPREKGIINGGNRGNV